MKLLVATLRNPRPRELATLRESFERLVASDKDYGVLVWEDTLLVVEYTLMKCNSCNGPVFIAAGENISDGRPLLCWKCQTRNANQQNPTLYMI